MKIAIIGAGNMGGSIARGLAGGSVVGAEHLAVADLSTAALDALKAEYPAVHVTTDNQQAVDGADIVIFAVKPWLMPTVVPSVRLSAGQVLVSIAAGVTLAQLQSYVEHKDMPLFRLIPNTAIRYNASMTFICSLGATPEQEQQVADLFGTMGLTMTITEDKFPAATALTSCGIAYVLKYIQAAMQAAIELGFRPADAMRMVAQSAEGAAKLILEADTHPSLEIDKVCTPGGLTIKGINTLEHEGFTSAVIKAIKQSL